jgi:DNA polymerase-3 subunit gamma/tau
VEWRRNSRSWIKKKIELSSESLSLAEPAPLPIETPAQIKTPPPQAILPATEKEKATPKISIPKESAKPRATLNLNSIFKAPAAKTEAKEEKNGTSAKADEPFTEESLRRVWKEYAEQRKSQVAEYHLLSQSFTLANNLITLTLTNPVEETFLVAIKADLLGYLREKLNNNAIQLEGVLEHTEVKRKAYTNKEKFEFLAEKNPYLKQLHEKFGLDPDF